MLRLQSAAGNAAVSALLARSAQGMRVQRELKVGAVDYTKRVNTDGEDLETVVAEVLGEAEKAAKGTDIEADFTGNREAIRVQLRKWIEHDVGKAGLKSHPEYGRKAQFRAYDEFEGLARGLLGWVQAKPGRSAEKAFAEEVRADPAVEQSLNALLTKVYAEIWNIDDSRPSGGGADILIELISKGAGAYDEYFEHVGKPISKPLSVLEKPQDHDFRTKVAVLHDMMEYLGPMRKRSIPGRGHGLLDTETGLDAIGFTTGVSSGGTAIRDEFDRGMGKTSSTRDEKNKGTVFARKHKIPVWASQSYTTARMFKLAEWAKATPEEKKHLSQAIVAFWRREYDHTSIAYHTLHEVMDVTRHFGVPYEPLDPFGSLSDGQFDKVVDAGFSYLERVTASTKLTYDRLDKVTPRNPGLDDLLLWLAEVQVWTVETKGVLAGAGRTEKAATLWEVQDLSTRVNAVFADWNTLLSA